MAVQCCRGLLVRPMIKLSKILLLADYCFYGVEQYPSANRGRGCSETKQARISHLGCVALVQALLLQSKCVCKPSDQPSRRL